MVGPKYNVDINDDVEPLTRGRWSEWSREVLFSFMEAGLSHYLDGSVPAPTEPKELAEWTAINSRIIGTLGLNVDGFLAQELHSGMSAADAWTLLKERTHQDGMLAKFTGLRTAFSTKFSHSEPTSETLYEIRGALAKICEGGTPPTREELSILLLLNALEGTDYDWLFQSLVMQFVNPKTAPNEEEVVGAIRFAGYDRRRRTLEDENLANISKDGNAKKKAKCTNPNCKSTKHTINKCWHDGGGAMDKAPYWWRETQAAKKKKAKSVNANVDTPSETANLAFENRFEDGHMSCPAVYKEDVPVQADERWSGD